MSEIKRDSTAHINKIIHVYPLHLTEHTAENRHHLIKPDTPKHTRVSIKNGVGFYFAAALPSPFPSAGGLGSRHRVVLGARQRIPPAAPTWACSTHLGMQHPPGHAAPSRVPPEGRWAYCR